MVQGEKRVPKTGHKVGELEHSYKDKDSLVKSYSNTFVIHETL